MIWIRVRRSEADGTATRESGKVTACAVCGEPAAGWGYDGLDPNEQQARTPAGLVRRHDPLPAGVHSPLIVVPARSGDFAGAG
jgi:hypothetical protein